MATNIKTGNYFLQSNPERGRALKDNTYGSDGLEGEEVV